MAQFERHVPADVQTQARGRTLRIDLSPALGESEPLGVSVTIRGDRVRFSLRTPDKALLARRHADAQATLEAFFEGLRRGPQRLSFRQCVALSGDVYRRIVGTFAENPLSPEEWMAFKGLTRAALEGRITDPPVASVDVAPDAGEALARFGEGLTEGIDALPRIPDAIRPALERRVGLLTDQVLAQHGLVADDVSRDTLLRQVATAVIDAGRTLKTFARGDYRPDTVAERFPPVEASRPQAPAVTFDAIADAWENALGVGARPAATVRAYRRVATQTFPSFLRQRAGHEDPSRVTTADIRAWRQAMQAEGLTQKTIRHNRLTALRAVLTVGVEEGLISADPTERVKVRLKPSNEEREKGFTTEEAQRVLTASRSAYTGKRTTHLLNAIRWVPWICAYTGCRVTEACQLRKADFSERSDGWWVRITPEAGSVKTGKWRDVPIHSALVEEGLIKFINQASNGPLFYSPTREGAGATSAASIGGKVGKWVRKDAGVTDPRVKPNHGWRHAFKTAARSVNMDQEARDYIQGHKTPGAAGGYGNMAGLPAQIERLPRWI